ncbi:MAG TPA: D-2-hydroxyacid dehydrogenase [Rikenellaceae bacterium]|nr:D-2-hydroxyacid dehydrogenase [Rikenellaceae bacterium]
MDIVFLDAATMGTSSLGPIENQGRFTAWPNSTPEEALSRVCDCDVLIVNKIKVNDQLLDAAPRLRLVCEAGTGINNIDVEACSRRGIIVRNVAGYSTDSVVQETFMHILNLLGNGAYFDNVVKSGAYSRSGLFTDYSRPFIEMAGKTLGVIGLGAIGTKVAKIGTAFGMKVIYYSTSGTNHNAEYPSVPLERLMHESDVISVHAPYNERTAGLVGEKELRMMKPKAVIVNMGRGGIVVEEALAKVIDEGVIGGAGLDVYSVEPIPADHPLLHTRHPERLSLTPHIAWASVEARERLIQSIADNIAKGF